MKPPSVSVVVPLFNEEENVAILQQEIREALAGLDHELILVDDASTDATASRVVRGAGVRLLRFSENAGQSAALLAGMRAATAPRIALLDGDLQNDPRDLRLLIKAIDDGADLACGYRAQRKDNALKRLTSRIANYVRSRFVGDGIRDTGCALKVMRRECVQAIVPFKGFHRFIPALVKSAGFRIVELPVNHRPRQFGKSKYGLRNRALKATTDMLGVRWLQARRIRADIVSEQQPTSLLDSLNSKI